MADEVAPIHPGWWAANEKPEERQRRNETTAAARAAFGPLLVENPLAVRVQPVPHGLRLSPGWIEWTLGDPARYNWHLGWRADGYHPPNPVPVPEDVCLAAFMRLADERDETQFLQFAQRYGVLGLCPAQDEERREFNGVRFWAGDEGDTLQYWYPGVRDGSLPPRIPLSLETGDRWRRSVLELGSVDAEDAWMRWYQEPIAGWRGYAREARTIVRIALAVQQGRQAGDEEWECFSSSQLEPYVRRRAVQSLEYQRGVLAHLVSRRWIANAGVTLQLHWYTDGVPRIELTTGGFYGPSRKRPKAGEQEESEHDLLTLGWPLNSLFSTIALQLVAVVCANERLIQCAECGAVVPYQGERRPRIDQPHYCSTACKDKARREDKRESAARRRAREKKAKAGDAVG